MGQGLLGRVEKAGVSGMGRGGSVILSIRNEKFKKKNKRTWVFKLLSA